MKALLELERIATTVRHQIPPPSTEPRKVRRKREREQIRQMKRKDLSASTANGSDIQSSDILPTPSQCDRCGLLPPATSTTKLHTGSAGFKRFIVSKMPNATTTAKTMDLISILYVLSFRFQRWLAGDLTGLIPTGRSSPVVGGNTPILTLSQLFSLQGAYVVYH